MTSCAAWTGTRPCARRALTLLADRLNRLTAFTEHLAFLDVTGRLAAVLLDMAEHHGQRVETGILLQPHLTQAELARYARATRESVNKALGTLRDEGLIWQEGHVLTILDPGRLAAQDQLLNLTGVGGCAAQGVSDDDVFWPQLGG